MHIYCLEAQKGGKVKVISRHASRSLSRSTVRRASALVLVFLILLISGQLRIHGYATCPRLVRIAIRPRWSLVRCDSIGGLFRMCPSCGVSYLLTQPASGLTQGEDYAHFVISYRRSRGRLFQVDSALRSAW
jgi:hypothetical protein